MRNNNFYHILEPMLPYFHMMNYIPSKWMFASLGEDNTHMYRFQGNLMDMTYNLLQRYKSHLHMMM